LPFPEFLRTVCDWIDSVQWFSADDGMFHLARAIKWHPATAKLAPTDAWEATCSALVEHDIEQPRLGADLDSEDGAVDFCAKWEKARFPFGGDPVELAFQEAGQGYLTTQTKRPGRYSLFLTVAALLQLERGCRPILLPVHRLAELFDCRPMTVSAWLRWASDDGVLVKVAEHQFRPGGGGRAAEYLLGLHRWRTDTVRTLAARVKVRVTTKELQKLKSAFERRPDA
jgi:hypothetical protein